MPLALEHKREDAMSDLITGAKERPLRQKMHGPKVLSFTAHVSRRLSNGSIRRSCSTE
jgi:hypothetical protein